MVRGAPYPLPVPYATSALHGTVVPSHGDAHLIRVRVRVEVRSGLGLGLGSGLGLGVSRYIALTLTSAAHSHASAACGLWVEGSPGARGLNKYLG